MLAGKLILPAAVVENRLETVPVGATKGSEVGVGLLFPEEEEAEEVATAVEEVADRWQVCVGGGGSWHS